MTPAWTARTDAVQTFSRYCAPTVLAALMGVPRAEAADLLLSIPGMPHQSQGSVSTGRFCRFLKEDLGGQEIGVWEIVKSHPDYTAPGEFSMKPNRLPTVTQFLRTWDQGTFVLFVRGHVLLAQDGEVLADSMATNSARARVQIAIQMPARAEGLKGADLAQVNGNRRNLLAHRERRREARKTRQRERTIRVSDLNRFFSLTMPRD